MPLHPFIASMMDQMAQADRSPVSAGRPEAARAMLAASRLPLGAGPDVAEVIDLKIQADHGAIPARLFRPAQAHGLIVHLHGGGWVLGVIDDFDAVARALAVDSGAAVLLPEYRLAPEHPFPAAVDDACSTLRFAAENLQMLAPGARGIVVAGDSAGGNLAGVAALEVDDPKVLGQILLYPVGDHDFSRPSYVEHGTGLPLSRDDMKWFFDHYADASIRSDPRIALLRRGDLGKAPPSLVVTAEYDVLRDEGEELAGALKAAGVAVELRRIEGLAHGFIRLGNVLEPARDVVRSVAAFARGKFAQAEA